MPLVNMTGLLKDARKEGFAVGAFSVATLPMMLGVVAAAEQLRAPVIIQVAQVRLDPVPLAPMAAAMLAVARGASVPVCVHLDHGTSLSVVKQALDLGFSSVMYDGSRLSLQDNIRDTQTVMSWAREKGASVEAELGAVARGEDGSDSAGTTTSLEECLAFCKSVPVDALAIGIGNAHGLYKETPKLDFELVGRVSQALDTPLVLHGATGIAPDEIGRLIGLGIAKINIATDLFLGACAERRACGEDLFANLRLERDRCAKQVASYLSLFGSEGRA